MSFLFIRLLGLLGFKALPNTKQDIPVHHEVYAVTDELVRDIEGEPALDAPQNAWSVLKDSPYDFVSDESLRKYVGPHTSLSRVAYVPHDLVSLEGIEYIQVRSNEGKLRKVAASALTLLANAFYKEFNTPLVIVSSYRGYAYQKKLLAGYTAQMGTGKAQGLSALPGHSEHQLGLAIDVFNTSLSGEGYKSYFAWMRVHAHEYGWTQSYQKGAKTDGYVVEPWHWRYVGVVLATYLWKNHMTFSEYVHG